MISHSLDPLVFGIERIEMEDDLVQQRIASEQESVCLLIARFVRWIPDARGQCYEFSDLVT